MTAYDIIFYLLGGFILGNAVLAMTTPKIFRAAIFLLFTLMGVAGLYFWMHVEFVAAVQIIVYVGGIVVLIIFSIFLTQESGTKMPKVNNKRMVFSLLASVCGIVLTMLLINQYAFPEIATTTLDASPNKIGMQMLDYSERGYALPFEVISILLLSAMVGCITIALKSNPEEV